MRDTVRIEVEGAVELASCGGVERSQRGVSGNGLAKW